MSPSLWLLLMAVVLSWARENQATSFLLKWPFCIFQWYVPSEALLLQSEYPNFFHYSPYNIVEGLENMIMSSYLCLHLYFSWSFFLYSMVSRPLTVESPGNLVKTENLGSHSLNWNRFGKMTLLPTWLLCTLNFENHSFRTSWISKSSVY